MEEAIILLRYREYLDSLRSRLQFNDAGLGSIKCYLPSDLKEFRGVKYIFSTWDMPVLSVEEIEKYFPDLEAVFYAAGTTRYFGRPYLERGVRIFSATEANGQAVAEFTIAQILLANKGYFMASKGYGWSWKNKRRYRMNQYSRKHAGNFNSTVGIIGLGNIGKKVAELAGNFDLTLIGYDPYVDEDVFRQLHVKRVGLEELFAEADVVTCHLPNIESTKEMIDERLLDMMKPYATFINTGRGDQVNEKDLCKVMKKRQDLTALLDVTQCDKVGKTPAFSLFSQRNIILSPHIAGSENKEINRMTDYVYKSYLQYRGGEKPQGEVTADTIEQQT